MAVPHDCLDCAAAIGSAIGAVKGRTGMGYGVAAFNKTEDLKSLDLRIRPKLADATLRLSAGELPDVLSRADKSRTASLAAHSLGLSGVPQAWSQQDATDMDSVRAVSALHPANAKDYARLTQRQLETEPVSTHELQLRVDRLSEKSVKYLADDAEAVKRRINVAQQPFLVSKHARRCQRSDRIPLASMQGANLPSCKFKYRRLAAKHVPSCVAPGAQSLI